MKRRKRRTNAEIAAVVKSFESQYDSERNPRPLAWHGIGSKHRAWWRCENCKQSYRCGIEAKIVLNAQCKVCRGLPLLGDEFPRLRTLFDEKRNRVPLDSVIRGTHKRYWFICDSCGVSRRKVFKQVVAALAAGTPCCRHCYFHGGADRVQATRVRRMLKERGSLKDRFPHIAAEWDATRNPDGPENYLAESGARAFWVCAAGHRWSAIIRDRLRGRGCRKCGQHISQYEKRIVTELKALGINAEWNARVDNTECDVLLLSNRIVIEADGFPWHDDEAAVGRERRKEQVLRKHGLTVIRWRDSQLRHRKRRSVTYQHEGDNGDSLKRLFRMMLAYGTFSAAERAAVLGYCREAAGFVAEAEFQALQRTTATALFRTSFAAARPELVCEWSDRNLPLRPDQIARGAKRKVWWRCRVNRTHEWEAAVKDRARHGCPQCWRERQKKGRSRAVQE
jgi:very-short-patch-repair endonuclease